MAEPRSGAASLEIHILGPFRVAVDGEPVAEDRWQRRQAKTLVKLLALEPHFQAHREVLMDRLWPEAAPDLAANNLNKVIYAARRALEPSLARGGDSAFIVTRDQHVQLRAPGGLLVDAVEFERRAAEAMAGDRVETCETALALYAGDLLVENRYDEWLDARRDRLRSLRLDLVERLAALHETRGDAWASAALLFSVLEVDPFDEGSVRRLMRVLAATGHRDRAFRLYEELVERLRAELDAEPEAETRALAEEIRTAAPAPAPAARPRSSLPRRGTRFVGRERDVAEIGRVLAASRLVTLTGLGGIGKTRLATQAAADLAPEHGGAWLVDLAAIADPGLVGRAAAATLGVTSGRDAPSAVAIAAALGDGPAVVVLDNCEHVVEAAAHFAAELLDAAPTVRVLATSREPLGVEGEIVWRVQPLSVPPMASGSAARLDDYEATRLFLDRARLRAPGYAPSDEAAAAIGELCRRLDGLPLAIELAAANVGAFAVDQIVARLDDRLQFAGGGERAERHRTLRAVMDWSFELLDEPEQRLLEELSVFSGGFTLDAARAAHRSAPDAEQLLTRLVDTSLVSADTSGEEVRYWLLETVRIYAAERLAARGAERELRRAHALWFAGYAESVEPELHGPNQRHAVARLNAERENLWSALRWSLANLAADGGAAARLCGSLWIWLQRSHLDESRAWFERVLAASEGAPPERVARVLHGLGNFCRLQGDFAEAAAHLERAIETWRGTGDRTSYARAVQTLASLLPEMGEYERGAALHQEAADICRDAGDVVGYARSVNWFGVQAILHGRFDEAREWLEEALALYRSAGAEANAMVTLHNLGEVACLTGDLDLADRLSAESLDMSRRISENLIAPHSIRLRGDIAARRGDPEGARCLYRQATEIHRTVGDRPGLVRVLESAGHLAAASGEADLALRLAGSALAAREQAGLILQPFERDILNTWTAEARAALGPEAADRALARGRLMPLEAALELGLGVRGPGSGVRAG
jgi:predicted ATPase/DNA-binding SARP family transcriptional activator/Tfp pilus assembly protein PilF